jgi:hypothetical protein
MISSQLVLQVSSTVRCQLSVQNLKSQIVVRVTLSRDEDDAMDALIFDSIVKDGVPIRPITKNVFFISHGPFIEMGVPNRIVDIEDFKPGLTERDLS